jgi:hypothetical protein
VKRLALIAVLSATAGTARADGERALSVGIGYATFSVPGEAMDDQTPPNLSPTGGGALGVTYERSLGTDVWLRADLTGGLFYGGAQMGQNNTSFAALGDAGVTYRFDVFKYVPYAFAGLGAVVSGGGPIDRGTDLVVVIGGGLDKLYGRSLSWGGEVRLASFGGDITVFTIGIRRTVRWGFF